MDSLFFPALSLGLAASLLCSFNNRWQKDVVGMLEEKRENDQVSVSFECETLKADKAAEEHIRKFMPKLVGMDAVGKNYKHILSFWMFKAVYLLWKTR